jgi:hypothetical protein
METGGHRAVGVSQARQKSGFASCAVCRLELNFDKSLKSEGMKKNVGFCSCCGVIAHTIDVSGSDCNRKIHQLPEFAGLMCFQIMHTKKGMSVWSTPDPHAHKARLSIKTSSAIYTQLREQEYGLPPKKRSKPTPLDSQNGDDNNTNDPQAEGLVGV